MKTYTNAYMYLFKWLAVCHAFKIDRNAIQVTGVKSVRKNIKPIFKRPSSDWNKQNYICGFNLAHITRTWFLCKYPDRSETKRDQAKITLASQRDRLQSDFKGHSRNWNDKKQNNNSSVKFADWYHTQNLLIHAQTTYLI